MGKSLFITEKPSVAKQFAEVLGSKGLKNNRSYFENDDYIITWCVGHLVTMSYPDAYDPALKKWKMETIPFLPEKYKYEISTSTQAQFNVVKSLLTRSDVDTIYVCTDSGREGEYIYRLVEQESFGGVPVGKNRRRVWIDSQTEDEIKRGIKEAKDLSEYDNLSDAAYLRAKEDYLMGINFSRALTLKYGDGIARFLGQKYSVVAVGRVMTCVLGMVVRREREIREFVKTPFYRVVSSVVPLPCEEAGTADKSIIFDAEWKAVPGTKYFETPALYKENGFKKEEDAKELIQMVYDGSSYKAVDPALVPAVIESAERKTEKKSAPLLYNLAELQNDCAKLFKISPDETLRVIQELYERKLLTYPRTDARVLSTAIAKEIDKNIKGLLYYPQVAPFAKEILDGGMYKGIEKTKYTNDKMITDHYAIIPTGQGLNGLGSLPPLSQKVYEIVARRFLAIFYGPTVYQKMSLAAVTECGEKFFAGFKVMTDEGFRKATKYSFVKPKIAEAKSSDETSDEKKDEEKEDEQGVNPELLKALKVIKKGSKVTLRDLAIKEGETKPPSRYNSGALIIAMENAGKFIEDEELREQIKGSGIGTAATRGEILKKLDTNKYLKTNSKTQIVTPTLLGEMIFEVVRCSIPQLLNAELTASWEKGLSMVAEGTVSEKDYMQKLNTYVGKRTQAVKGLNNAGALQGAYVYINGFYSKEKK